VRRIWPDAWEKFMVPLTPRERGAVLRAYHRRLTSEDPEELKAAALAWNAFEETASRLLPDPAPAAGEDVPHQIAVARIEAHYFVNGTFLESDDQLLRDAGRLRTLPGVIVQGRYDLVCPMQSAWDLAAAWPDAHLVVVPGAGHAADEPGIASALVEATEAFKVSRTP
jgi:proline iminopeptidase